MKSRMRQLILLTITFIMNHYKKIFKENKKKKKKFCYWRALFIFFHMLISVPIFSQHFAQNFAQNA